MVFLGNIEFSPVRNDSQRLVNLRVPVADHSFGAGWQLRQLFTGENHQYQLQTVLPFFQSAIEYACPLMEGFRKGIECRVHTVAGANIHESGTGTAAGAGSTVDPGMLAHDPTLSPAVNRSQRNVAHHTFGQWPTVLIHDFKAENIISNMNALAFTAGETCSTATKPA